MLAQYISVKIKHKGLLTKYNIWSIGLYNCPVPKQLQSAMSTVASAHQK